MAVTPLKRSIERLVSTSLPPVALRYRRVAVVAELENADLRVASLRPPGIVFPVSDAVLVKNVAT